MALWGHLAEQPWIEASSAPTRRMDTLRHRDQEALITALARLHHEQTVNALSMDKDMFFYTALTNSTPAGIPKPQHHPEPGDDTHDFDGTSRSTPDPSGLSHPLSSHKKGKGDAWTPSKESPKRGASKEILEATASKD